MYYNHTIRHNNLKRTSLDRFFSPLPISVKMAEDTLTKPLLLIKRQQLTKFFI